MNESLLYLLLNVGAISVPFIASFYPKAPFIRTWRAILPAIVLPLILFVAWDIWFTQMGVWGFNDRYLSGMYLLNLPIEEWLFFVTIPYACLFTYFSVKYFRKIPKLPNSVSGFLAVLFLVIGLVNVGRWYTCTTFVGLGTLFAVLSKLKWPYLGQFFVSYLLILIPFFLINGVLTGSWVEDQVVWYNNSENLGMRMGTIPIEDAFYGMFLLLLNTVIWERLTPNTQPE